MAEIIRTKPQLPKCAEHTSVVHGRLAGYQAVESPGKRASHSGHWKQNTRHHEPQHTVTAFCRVVEGLQQLNQSLWVSPLCTLSLTES